ncbi:MAG: beta strand repeat-containing protein [Pyrinomonadaceae bacterium]
MTHYTPSLNSRNRRTLIASVLTYVMLMSQLAPMAMAINGSAVSNARAGTSDIERKNTSEVPPEGRVVDSFAPVPVPLRVTTAGMVPIITATKVDSFPDPDMDGKVSPGQTITYSVTITNSGPDPATNLTLTDTIDPNTTLVPGSAVSTPIAFADAYNVVGNVRIQPNAAQGLLANDINPDTGNNTGLTASGGTTSTQGGNVAINADGSFSYDPPVGFTGTDTFTYTATSANGTDTRTVTLTVAGMIFFVNDDDPTAGGDGRLTNPFNCLVGAGCFSASTADEAGDNIFLLNGAYTGGLTLLANQKLIGQGASDTLANIAGVGAVEPYSDPLPVTNGNPTSVTITTGGANAITLAPDNTIRGFTVGNTGAGTKIIGNGFGFLTAGNSTLPDLVLNGTGQALNLNNGTFVATSAFASVATTSSAAQGISLTGNIAGTVAFGSTTVSGSAAQGILVSQSTVSVNFGNTSVSGGTDGISLQNNSAGTRTFGTLSISNNSGVGFLHGAGGGNANVTGATSIPATGQIAPVGTGIDIQSLAGGTTVTFAATTVNKANAGTGVNLGGGGGTGNVGNVTFNSLAITTSNGPGLVGTGNTGQINVTTNAGSISSTNGPAINITKAAAPATPITLNFSTVASTNSGTQGINLDRVSGNMTIIATTVTNPTGAGIQVQNTSVGGTMNFGNTNSTQSGGTGVLMSANAGAVTFADLDITPDSSQRALLAQNNTGAITSTTGTVSTTTATAVEITGVSAVTRTPLNMQFESISANGSNSIASGLVLTNASATGSPGGFRINGTGTTDGSGGTIQNTTTRGANLNNVDSLVLRNINFTNANATTDAGGAGVCDDLNIAACHAAIYLNGVTTLATLDNLNITGTMVENGITAVGVANFKLDNSILDGCGNEANESCVEAQNLSGTSTVTSTEIRFSETNSFDLVNTDQTLNLTVSGSTFRDTQTTNSGGPVNTNGEGGFQFRSFSTAAGTPTTTINILNSSFLRLRTQGIQAIAEDDTILNIDINGNSIDAQADIGTGIDLNSNDTAKVNFNVISNPTIQSRGGGAVNITSFLNSDIEGRINNNSDIEVLGGAGIAVRLVAQETSRMIVEINGNTVSNINGTEDTAIDVQSRFQTARVDATITNNNVSVEPTGIASINLISGSSTAGESNITCGDVANNTTNGAAVAARAFRIRISDLSNTNRMFLEGFVEAGTSLQDTEATWNSRGNTPVSSAGSEVAVSVTGTAVGPLAPPGGVCNAVDISGDFSPAIAQLGDVHVPGAPVAQVAATSSTESITSRPFISSPQRRSLAGAAEIIPANHIAIAERNRLGLSAHSKRDGGTAFNYAAAATSAPLGQTQTRGSQDKQTQGGGGKAGAPSTTGSTSQQTAAPPKPTVRTATPGVVVDPGVRFVPKPRPVVTPPGDGLPTPPVITGDTLTWNVGTLPAGQSVTITFQVVVDDPIAMGVTQVSNQGTVTADGGINVLTNDPDTAAPNDPTITGVTAPPDLFVRDASVPEPASGSSSMIFTLALSTPAPMSGITVTLSTADGTANGGDCASGNDYTTVTGGTVTFAAGEQLKTFPVTVCSDANVEGDENFSLNVTSAPGATIADAQGIGTITANVPGTILISELRTSGPGGAGDDFVEIYNNTDTAHTVPAGGYGLFKRGADCNALPILVGTIPAATVIPQRGHYLFVGTTYSLANYGGTGAATGDNTLMADIESDFNVGLFSTTDPLQISTTNRLDAVGFGVSTGGVCDLLLEGTTLQPASGSTSEHSFVRKFTLVSNDVPTPRDVNDNAADFTVVSTTPAAPVGSNAAPKLGAPGPENRTGPNLKKFSQVGGLFLDQTQPNSASPNRLRNLSPVTNGANGTISIRRRFVNNTGGSITRLRFRIYDITTFPVPAGTADLRALSSLNVSINGVMDPGTCAATGTPATPPCMVNAEGTTLETPPAQPNGGGLNSSMAAGTVTTGTPVVNGASINLQFLFGVQQGGSFRVFVIVEALP